MRACFILLLGAAMIFSTFAADTTGTEIPVASPTPTPSPAPVPTPVPTPAPTTPPAATEVKPATVSDSQLAQVYSDHYRLLFEGSEADAQVFIQKMEACLALYNSLLHFDLSKLTVKLKVRVFRDKTGFDNYCRLIIKETKSDFVYIHYSDLGKSELVSYIKENTAEMNNALLHQGFVQFLKAFVGTPPIWLQEGLAAYFEQATYAADKNTFTLPADLIWLPTLKKIVSGTSTQPMITFDTFLTFDKTAAQMQIETFYPQAWGLVYFLLNSPDRDINRILWDAIAALDPGLTAVDNAKRVMEKAFAWYGITKVEKEFVTYVGSIKTYSDMISEGVALYTNNEFDKASEVFNTAMTRGDSYIPYYYLGLISYNKKNYLDAETFYVKARDLKAPGALISYAIGVNAYADNNFDKAKSFLNEARTSDPLNYTEKVDQILETIALETAVPN